MRAPVATATGRALLALATVLTLVSLWLILRAPDAIGIETPLGAFVTPTTVAGFGVVLFAFG